MNAAHVSLACGLLLSVLCACNASEDAAKPVSATARQLGRVEAPPPPPPPADQGDVMHYLACTAKPRRALSAREQCVIDAYSRACTPAKDCLVSCITSPHGIEEGGGCSHVCFFGLHAPSDNPGIPEECQSLDPGTITAPAA